MANTPDPKRAERFTMLEPRGPNNPSPEELATRIVQTVVNERFTMLEPRGPNNSPLGSDTRPIVEAKEGGELATMPPLYRICSHSLPW